MKTDRNYLARVRAALLGLALAAALSACSTSVPTPGFEVQLIPGRSLQIVQGSSAELTVRLTRNGFTDPITVTAGELPAGVTAGAVTTTGSTVKLRFLAAADALQGEARSVTLFATAAGKASAVVTTSLFVRGAPGAIDTTFSGGRVLNPATVSFRTMAALAPNGGIVIAGSNASSSATVLLRLTADGQPDPSFPVRTMDLAPGTESVGALALQPDGKIVVAVMLSAEQIGFRRLGAARFTAQGDLDPSFSGDGLATLAPLRDGRAFALALAPDGKIVVAGVTFNGQNDDILLARFSPDGQPSLGASGFITDAFTPRQDSASAVAVAPDGSIIVAGQAREETFSGSGTFVDRQALARYRPDGSKDAGFGIGGHFILPFADNATATALALQADGKIVVVGPGRLSGVSGLIVTRLLPHGFLDQSFSGGIVRLSGQTARGFGLNASSVVLEPGGRIVVAGTTADAAEKDFALTRLEPSGKFDLSFGDGGRRFTDFGGTFDEVNALLRAADGRLVLVGRSGSALALSRYWP